MRDIGLAAEEVAQVEPLLTYRNAKGEIEGVKYNQLSAIFINAFKEQQEQIKQQQTEIESLRLELRQVSQQKELLKQQRAQSVTQQTQLREQQLQVEALTRLVCSTRPKATACQSRRTLRR